MSTTPLTSDSKLASYSVIGNQNYRVERKSAVSVVVVNRSEAFWNEKLIETLCGESLDDIISVEATGVNKDFRKALDRFGALRFVVTDAALSVGEMINCAMAEALHPWVLVMWNDMNLTASSLNVNFLERLKKSDSLFINPLCCSPANQIIPSIAIPLSYKRSRLKIAFGNMKSNASESLFPFHYCALYDRKKFLALGGFDGRFKQSNFWQLADFGFRGYLQGFHSSSDSQLRFICPPLVSMDSTVNEDYLLFYLKNLGFHFIPNGSYLPYRHYFKLKNGSGLSDRWKLFRELRESVRLNREKIKRSPIEVVDQWNQN